MTEGVPVAAGDKINTSASSVGHISPNVTVKVYLQLKSNLFIAAAYTIL